MFPSHKGEWGLQEKSTDLRNERIIIEISTHLHIYKDFGISWSSFQNYTCQDLLFCLPKAQHVFCINWFLFQKDYFNLLDLVVLRRLGHVISRKGVLNLSYESTLMIKKSSFAQKSKTQKGLQCQRTKSYNTREQTFGDFLSKISAESKASLV